MTKTALLLLAALYLTTNAYSQYLKTSFGFQGGLSRVSQQISSDGISRTLAWDNGITFGILLDKPIANHLSFQSGLSYISQGSIMKNSYSGSQASNTFKLKYIELPVSIVVKSNAGNCGVFVGAGVAASYAVDALVIIKQGSENSKKVKYSIGNGDDDIFKPFDFGANIQGGIQLKCGLLMSASYYLGISNIINADPDKVTNRYFAVKLGFLFHDN